MNRDVSYWIRGLAPSPCRALCRGDDQTTLCSFLWHDPLHGLFPSSCRVRLASRPPCFVLAHGTAPRPCGPVPYSYLARLDLCPFLVLFLSAPLFFLDDFPFPLLSCLVFPLQPFRNSKKINNSPIILILSKQNHLRLTVSPDLSFLRAFLTTSSLSG